jgi:hypothetical protein
MERCEWWEKGKETKNCIQGYVYEITRLGLYESYRVEARGEEYEAIPILQLFQYALFQGRWKNMLSFNFCLDSVLSILVLSS